jgi:hypothetical protein
LSLTQIQDAPGKPGFPAEADACGSPAPCALFGRTALKRRCFAYSRADSDGSPSALWRAI